MAGSRRASNVRMSGLYYGAFRSPSLVASHFGDRAMARCHGREYYVHRFTFCRPPRQGNIMRQTDTLTVRILDIMESPSGMSYPIVMRPIHKWRQDQTISSVSLMYVFLEKVGSAPSIGISEADVWQIKNRTTSQNRMAWKLPRCTTTCKALVYATCFVLNQGGSPWYHSKVVGLMSCVSCWDWSVHPSQAASSTDTTDELRLTTDRRQGGQEAGEQQSPMRRKNTHPQRGGKKTVKGEVLPLRVIRGLLRKGTARKSSCISTNPLSSILKRSMVKT